MLCLAHNLATERTRALGLPVWRYRFDLVADNLNSRGTRIGAFHGKLLCVLLLIFKLTIFQARTSALSWVHGGRLILQWNMLRRELTWFQDN
jgi:hypothetical protein